MREFVDQHRDTHGVEPICKVLQIAPSGYWRYAAQQRTPALRSARTPGKYRVVFDEPMAARELDEAIRLCEAVFEVNADFFIQRLAPILARVANKVETIGARYSSASSSTATATPTS